MTGAYEEATAVAPHSSVEWRGLVYRRRQRWRALVPARLLRLPDRGRLQPGFRADLAILDSRFRPLETIIGGETVWSARG